MRRGQGVMMTARRTHVTLWTMALVWSLLAVSKPVLAWTYMDETKIKWRSYGDSAFAEARKTDRPLFVFVFADWCDWCRKYEVEALETPAIRRQLQTKYIPVAVDYVKQKELGDRLGAKLVPTTVLLTPQGEKLVRFYGVLNAGDLAETLDEVLAAWRKGELPERGDFGDAETCCPLPPPD